MVNRKNTNIARNADKLHDTESPSNSRSARSNLKDRSVNDDLIVSLSNAYENQRARQVSEWERVGYQNLYIA